MTPNRIARIRQSILDHYREHNAVDRCMNCQTAEVLIAVEKDSFRKGASMEREACATMCEAELRRLHAEVERYERIQCESGETLGEAPPAV